jgi:branched-chain amino acid transport system permease protein
MTDATLFLQLLVSGLSAGVLYVLMALGIAFVFSIMRMVNWSMGSFYMLGTYAQYVFVQHLLGPGGWLLALPLSIATVYAVASLIQPVLIRPMFTNAIERKEEYGTVVTIAFGLLAQGVAAILSGPFERSPGTTLANVRLGDLLFMRGDALVASIGAILIVAGFYLFLTRTWTGLAFQAVAQNRSAAQSAGIDLERVDRGAFAIGCSLAAAAGALLASVFLVFPSNGAIAATKGFEIVIIGGLGSLPGAVVAGLALGVVEALASGYLSSHYQNAYGFALVLLALFLRPQGLFGEKVRAA